MSDGLQGVTRGSLFTPLSRRTSLEGVEQNVVARLRARAQPLRLRMLSLLTGAALPAAELAGELEVSQALAR